MSSQIGAQHERDAHSTAGEVRPIRGSIRPSMKIEFDLLLGVLLVLDQIPFSYVEK
jgi:hypothetical protein